MDSGHNKKSVNMTEQDAGSGFGNILQILESLKKAQTQDMSAIQSELCKLSSELCGIRECQGLILQMLKSNELDFSAKNRNKKGKAEPQSLSEPEISSNSRRRPVPEKIFNKSSFTDCSEISESQVLFRSVLDDGCIMPTCSTKEGSSGEKNKVFIGESKAARPPSPQPLLGAAAIKVDEAVIPSTKVQADMCFVESDPNCCEQNTKIQPGPSFPSSPERSNSSLLHSLVAKGSRLLSPRPHHVAVESSVQTLFDDRLPQHRIVRKRILTCCGACSDGSTINALWRKFLLAIFGIQDDEVWTGKVGSAVIHPDSRFSRGEHRDRERYRVGSVSGAVTV